MIKKNEKILKAPCLIPRVFMAALQVSILICFQGGTLAPFSVYVLVIFEVTVEESMNWEHRIITLTEHVRFYYSCLSCNVITKRTRANKMLQFCPAVEGALMT